MVYYMSVEGSKKRTYKFIANSEKSMTAFKSSFPLHLYVFATEDYTSSKSNGILIHKDVKHRGNPIRIFVKVDL